MRTRRSRYCSRKMSPTKNKINIVSHLNRPSKGACRAGSGQHRKSLKGQSIETIYSGPTGCADSSSATIALR
jgi:hypothetical protein